MSVDDEDKYERRSVWMKMKRRVWTKKMSVSE